MKRKKRMSKDGYYSRKQIIDRFEHTVTEIINGVSVELTRLFNQKQWNDFKFQKVVYINEPIDVKGYWIVEKINNYQPENSNLVKIKLLQRIEYDVQVEASGVGNEETIRGRFAPAPISDDYNMTMTVQDGSGNDINVLMEATDLQGNKTTLIA